MKAAALISSIITGLLLLTTMICGLWIKANKITDPGSLDFHVTSGIASVVFSFITLALVIRLLARLNKKG
ncbi:MAG: hypothetical protein K0Q90_1878 [Paenibacillaceae bacterium]|nr:hypothetical protein [Paenibacillaceae bacterium]